MRGAVVVDVVRVQREEVVVPFTSDSVIRLENCNESPVSFVQKVLGGGFWLGVGLVRVDTNEFCGLRVYAVTLALLSQCESKLVRDPRQRFIWISAQFPSR